MRGNRFKALEEESDNEERPETSEAQNSPQFPNENKWVKVEPKRKAKQAETEAKQTKQDEKKNDV